MWVEGVMDLANEDTFYGCLAARELMCTCPYRRQSGSDDLEHMCAHYSFTFLCYQLRPP